MIVEKLITEFLEQQNIPNTINFGSLKAIQIYYQFKEHTDNLMAKATEILSASNLNTIRKRDKKGRKTNMNYDINEVNAGLALEMLDCECSDEEEMYFSDEEESTQGNEADG